MPAKIYYLDAARTQALKVSWKMLWRDFTVAYQGQEIGQLSSSKALKEGVMFMLPDGRNLSAQLRSSMGQQQLELLLDGQPLPGSATDPQQQFKYGRYMLWLVAALNIGLGLLVEFGQIDSLQELGMGYGTVGFGVLFIGLEWWARTKKSSLAFYLAIGLLVLDVLATTMMAAPREGSTGTSGWFLRFIICMVLYRAAVAAKALAVAPAAEAELA
ncbi:hypothetical protein [Hymenobacter psychrophilus]|uniref:Uncharacterized protein n=1 Tax=Hymenobacter psychrophilus TaxID=651662 RepID=A0A1H3DK65_9BACT|nr:hypothetical protein [Hymenobacter psychrophilus]SDX66826.1 hypothetical protein SAMN04488069_102393 [Hymenobacter psychrophilus]